MAAVANLTTAPASRAASGTSHPFTCNTCQVAFRSSDLQRSHMQNDWHRYNLKRRVASLPPLTSEIFAEKVLANQASAAATAARASFERLCVSCQRTYFSENAYQNHLRSQKHRTKLAQLSDNLLEDDATSMTSSALSLGEPISSSMEPELYDPSVEAEFTHVMNGIKETTLQDSNSDPVDRRPTRPRPAAAERREEHPLSPIKSINSSTAETESVVTEIPPLTNTCLFCNLEFASLESNVEHMESFHSLFIPERAFLIDLGGLIEYLHEKVFSLHECLFCGHMKPTIQGIKTHMRDKGHCMIAFESEKEMIEVGQFYDFRSTYSDEELEDEPDDENESTGGVKLGAKRATTSRVAGADEYEDEVVEEDGWETDSSQDSGSGGNDATATPRPLRTVGRVDPSNIPQPRGAAYYDEYELHLPSGRTVGHRSLARYFRQNLSSYPSAVERANQRLIADSAMAAREDDIEGAEQRRGRVRELAVRNLGMEGVSNVKKMEVQAVERRERKREQRAQARYQWGNEKRANHQKHFRDPLLQ